ncbi:MAG TPA: sigma-70 family RNA polymerase sigma factor [Gemmataceae bacterium]|jgi:RNA polymerase sigma factor (sigma-70 family)
MPRSANLLSHLNRLAAPAATDAVLLARWVEQSDEAAFSALMARHGPMVLGVCRRLTGDAHRAEDVFQAVFLALARRASRLRRPEALAGFLHTIAVRLARKARAAAHRRQRVQAPLDAAEPLDPRPHPLDLLSGRELLALLDEEITRLPEVNRLPLLLCLMQGRTIEEAARLLGWSIGSLRGRLTRGRERLRQRLRRRGLDLSAGVVALLSPAAVPEHLRAACVHNLTAPATSSVHALTAGSTTLKLKGVGLALFLTVALGLGAGLTLLRAPEPETPAAAPPVAPPAQAKDEPRRDRYGDPLPPGAVVRLGSLRFRAPSEIRTMALAPNGKLLAVSSHAGLFLMDAVNGKRGKRLPTAGPHWTPESLLAFSPDGKRLISWGPRTDRRGPGGVVHIWELAGKEQPREHEIQNVIWLGWSGDGQPLAIRVDKGALHLHELTTGQSRRFACKEPRKYPSGALSSNPPLACAPAGRALALADNNNVIHVWDTVTGRERCNLEAKNADVCALVFSPDGRVLAALNHNQDAARSEAVQIWDATTGAVRHTVAADQKYHAALAFAADGETLATASGSGVRFWDVVSGRERGRLKGEGTDTELIVFTPDGRTLVMAERNSAAIHLWDVAAGERKPEPVGHRRRTRATFAPDGRRLASSGGLDGTIRFWNAATAEPLAAIHRRGEWVRNIAFSPDGRSLYSTWTDDKLWVSDAATGERLHTIELQDPERPNTVQSAISMYLSDDGKTLIALSYYYPKKNENRLSYQETLITGWDAATRKQLFRRRRPGWDSDVIPSADARVLAATYPGLDRESILRARISGAPLKGSIRLEDAATGEVLLTFPSLEGQIRPLAFSHDGRLLASNHYDSKRPGKAEDSKSVLHLWETATAARVLTLPAADFDHAAFSHDGRLLALTAPAQEIVVWDLRHGREHRRFKGFDAEVIGLAFSPDDRRLVSGLADSTLLVWDVGTPTAAGKLGADEVAKAWADLANSDAPRAFRARGMLASAPEETIPFLKEHLHPARPADLEQLRRLLADLGSDEFTVRETAQAELAEFGDLAAPALRQTLTDKPTLEVRRRVQALLDRLRGPVKRPEMLRSLRAIAVLEDIGIPETRRRLEELAKGADGARLTREAKAALHRLALRQP